jgi:hypothetical protein
LWLLALWFVVFDLGIAAYIFLVAAFDFLEEGDLNLKEYSMRQLAP